MNRFAAATATAALLAAAGTASAWIGWGSAWRADTGQETAAADDRMQMASHELLGPASSLSNPREVGGPGRSYYGWSYPYIFPFAAPQVIAQRPVAETHR